MSKTTVPELQQRPINAAGQEVSSHKDTDEAGGAVNLPAPAAPTEGPPARAEDQDFSIFAEALALTEQAVSPAEGPTPVGDAFNFWWAGIEERDDWSESVRQLAWSAWKASAARDGAVSAIAPSAVDHLIWQVENNESFDRSVMLKALRTARSTRPLSEDELQMSLQEAAQGIAIECESEADRLERENVYSAQGITRDWLRECARRLRLATTSASGTITKENP